MKSKRADVYMMDDSFDPDDYCGSPINSGSVVQLDTARKAVELAEQDARERAVKTYCKISILCGAQNACREGMRCRGALEYLNTYDNEN